MIVLREYNRAIVFTSDDMHVIGGKDWGSAIVQILGQTPPDAVARYYGICGRIWFFEPIRPQEVISLLNFIGPDAQMM